MFTFLKMLTVAFISIVMLISENVFAVESFIADTNDEFTEERSIHIYILPIDNDLDETLQMFREFDLMDLAKDYYSKLHPFIAFSCTKPMYFVIRTKEMLWRREGSTVDIKLRFDADPYISEDGLFGENIAGVTNAEWLLDKAISRNSLIAKMEDSETMHFDLLAARRNLTKFNELCRNHLTAREAE